MEECTFNWIYRNSMLITCLGLVVFTKEESQQYSYECNENGDITLLGLLQNSQVTIKEVAYKNGSSVFPNCTFTSDQYGHVIINRSCTDDIPELRHKVIVWGILDDKSVSSTTKSSSQTSISSILSLALSKQTTSISSVMSVIDVSTSPSTQDTSILSSTPNMSTSSTTSPTTTISTSSSTTLHISSLTSPTTLTTLSSTSPTTTLPTTATTILPTTTTTSKTTTFPTTLSTSTTTTLPTASLSSMYFREKRAVKTTQQTFMLTCQQYKNGVIHNILGQLIDSDTISLNPVYNSVGRVEMQFKSYSAETEDALKYLPDISTVYLGDKFFMFLKYTGQQDYKIVPQNCYAYDGGVAVTNKAKPNVLLWSYDSCVSEVARKYHLMHSFEKINDKIIFAELFGFHFVDDADITVECNVMICNKADNSPMCTLKQNDCGTTISNLRAKRTTNKYVKVVKKLKVMNRRQQYTENTAMKHRHNYLMLLIGAVVYGVEYLILA